MRVPTPPVLTRRELVGVAAAGVVAAVAGAGRAEAGGPPGSDPGVPPGLVCRLPGQRAEFAYRGRRVGVEVDRGGRPIVRIDGRGVDRVHRDENDRFRCHLLPFDSYDDVAPLAVALVDAVELQVIAI